MSFNVGDRVHFAHNIVSVDGFLTDIYSEELNVFWFLPDVWHTKMDEWTIRGEHQKEFATRIAFLSAPHSAGSYFVNVDITNLL